jgi:hypothetical protein
MPSPPPIDRAAAQVTHTRGASLKLYRKNLQALVDEATWHRILRACSEPVAAFLSRDVAPDEWIPTAWLIEAREVYLRCAGHNPWSARGGMMARPLYELGKDQGWFAGTGVGTVVADYPKLFAYLHRGGWAEVAALAPGRAELILWADFPYAEYPADYLPRFFTSLLQLRGAGLVRVRHGGPGPGAWDHHYHLNWHEPTPEDGSGPG